MQYNRLHMLILGAAAALMLLTHVDPSYAAPAPADDNPCPSPTDKNTPVDCDCISKKIISKESYKGNYADLDQCMKRGAPVPNGGSTPDSDPQGKNWVPENGKGAGVTAGGAGGFSYGSVRAPEAPPGSRNENASVSAAAITASCNFPPRIKIGIPPSISFPAGSCLDFLNGLFKDRNGNTGSSSVPGVTCPVAPNPDGTCPAESFCPADSNDENLYGVKKPAVGSIPVPCGGTVPVATADLTLNKNSNALVTATNGQYFIWSYHRTGNSPNARYTAGPGLALPKFLCGKTFEYKEKTFPMKTIDLTPPTEQMITYNTTDGKIAIRLQARNTMPASYVPPYAEGDPEKFLVLSLNAQGDPVLPPLFHGCVPESVFQELPANIAQDYLVQSAVLDGSATSGIAPTMVNYPTCSPQTCPHNQTPPQNDRPSCNALTNEKPNTTWCPVCNPGDPNSTVVPNPNPVPGWDEVLAPDANGNCFGVPTTTPTNPTTDENCDVVTMPVNPTPPSGAVCSNMQQYAALNRPSLFYSAGSNAIFEPIAGRTQVMAETAPPAVLSDNPVRFYMQANTQVTIRASAPPTVFAEGGSITQHNGSILMMNGPATLTPANAMMTLTNGGKLLSPGGSQLANYAPGATVPVEGGSPFNVTVGRSLTVPMYVNGIGGQLANYLIPTVPTIGSQPPYVQFPACTAGFVPGTTTCAAP